MKAEPPPTPTQSPSLSLTSTFQLLPQSHLLWFAVISLHCHDEGRSTVTWSTWTLGSVLSVLLESSFQILPSMRGVWGGGGFTVVNGDVSTIPEPLLLPHPHPVMVPVAG